MPWRKTPKQTLTGELVSISYKNSRTRGVSVWISIRFEPWSRNSNQTETFRDGFLLLFLLYLLIYLKARRKNGGKPETFRDIPRRSEVLDFRRFDSGFRSKFETDRDIPRHSGALDFRRFDSSFRSAVRCGLRSTLRGAPRAKNNPRARGRYIYIYI